MSVIRDFNINNECSVTLTEYGAILYNAYNTRWDFGKFQPKIVESGEIITLPTWEIMKIFGHCFHMGMIDMPFDKNIISIKEEL